MISDVLLNACDEIDDFFQDFPETYTPEKQAKILALKTQMHQLALELASPYSDAELVERGFVPLMLPEEKETR
jgi:hypothetical protein